MELRHVVTTDSPLGHDRVRIQGTVAYDDRAVAPECIWFDVPARVGGDVALSGDPWAAALLPLAVTLREPLRIPLPVDATLIEGLTGVMLIWRAWYPRLPIVPVEAAPPVSRERSHGTRCASFFSGGVDSFFTVLRHAQAPPARRQWGIDDLLCVWGLDIRIGNPGAFARLKDRLTRVAGELGKELVDVATNIRDTRWGSADWTLLAHGPLLASIGLLLGPRYGAVLVPSSIWLGSLASYGSHPLTDPCFSTSATRIVYDGATHTRPQKLEFLAGFDIALRSLRVCWELGGDENCGACRKCLRTMAVLDILGVLGTCPTFPAGGPLADRLPHVRLKGAADFRTYARVRDMAAARGRADIAGAVDTCMRRSRRALRLRHLRDLVSHPRSTWQTLRSPGP